MMSTSEANRIPTLDKLGVALTSVSDASAAPALAASWLSAFARTLTSGNPALVLALLRPDALWRDLLAFTWDFRTLDGAPAIADFLSATLPAAVPDSASFVLEDAQLQRPYPDLAWIVARFSFTCTAGHASGVARLVPTPAGIWKAHHVFTNLEELHGHPERVAALRPRVPVSGAKWAEARGREVAFADKDPAVLIIGGGHCGLEIAARLRCLDVPALIVERSARIGDNWRGRYDSLCLHWPIWYDHMPYVPFPPTWPLYTPSHKMGAWLESYAQILDLNVWTSATVLRASQDATSKKWTVVVRRADATERAFRVNHLVFATGIGDGVPNMPVVPGMDTFQGPILHSSQYKNATGYEGKKVVVVGSGNSAHDVAADLARQDIDVTMLQRSPTFVMNLDKQWKYMGGPLYSENSPPIEIADRLYQSMPHVLLENGLAQRATRDIVAGDKELIEKLNAVGFRTNLGLKDAGVLLLLKSKGGGHYFETGASQLIIDGKIKLKNILDAPLTRFSASALHFADGSELRADAVICATGIGGVSGMIRAVCGDTVADACGPIGGLDEEGETQGAWRNLGVPGLWYLLGPLQVSRFYSKHVALQIKAMETGTFGKRHSIRKESSVRSG